MLHWINITLNTFSMIFYLVNQIIFKKYSLQSCLLGILNVKKYKLRYQTVNYSENIVYPHSGAYWYTNNLSGMVSFKNKNVT